MVGRDDRIAGILGEFFARGGDPEEILRAHPELADELRAQFESLGLLDRALGALPRIARYRILRRLGRGPLGAVYEAEEPSRERRVALRVFAAGIPEESLERFRREAVAVTRLGRQAIAPVLRIGRAQGRWYCATAIGCPLDRAPQPPLDPHRIVRMFAGVAGALDAAHRLGILHRDIKPSNLVLGADGTLRIADFGLAPAEEPAGGAVPYLSPEVARRIAIDGRTDIYSLGAVLRELLGPNVPRRLRRILAKALAQDPERRYRTAGELARDLLGFAEGRGAWGRLWRWLCREPPRPRP